MSRNSWLAGRVALAFPWGLIWTPIQIGRNVMGIMRAEEPTAPSPQLTQIVRLQLATAARAQAASAFTPPPR